MATQRQIEANRRNARKSTGPSSVAGRAVSSSNALKTGIYAKSLVIPGEDPAQLEALAADYYRQFQPATPLARFLVDSLVKAEWLLRRFATIEAQLWLYESDKVRESWNVENNRILGLAFVRRVDEFTRLQRRMDAAERTYHRALKQLQGLDPAVDGAAAPAEPEPAPAPHSGLDASLEIGFVPPPSPAAPPPASPVAPEAPAAKIGFVPSLSPSPQEPLPHQKSHVAHAVPPRVELLLSQPRGIQDRDLAEPDARVAQGFDLDLFRKSHPSDSSLSVRDSSLTRHKAM